ncbi:MAG: hypothetical protein AAB381_02490 [Patescibacteria group bacterium]
MTILKKHTQGGFIRTIILIVIALLIISYFGLNLRDLADEPTTQDNFHYALQLVSDIWNNYLEKPFMYVWKEIFLDLIWNPAIEALKNKTVNGGN